METIMKIIGRTAVVLMATSLIMTTFNHAQWAARIVFTDWESTQFMDTWFAVLLGLTISVIWLSPERVRITRRVLRSPERRIEDRRTSFEVNN